MSIEKPEFVPRRAFFEPAALRYPLGDEIRSRLIALGVNVRLTTSHNRVTGMPGSTPVRAYAEAKLTLVVGVRRKGEFQSCKPSAHFQLPLATGCPGLCHYCYLQTTLGPRPYVRIYVNERGLSA